MIFTPHQMSLGDEIKKNEKGVAHSTYVRETRCKQFLVEKPGGQRPLRRPRSMGRITLKWIFRPIQIIHMTPGQLSGKH